MGPPRARSRNPSPRRKVLFQDEVVAPRKARMGGPRFWQFLKACWAELQRVQWPDRRQVAQATAVVLGFVVIAGTYLGVADRLAQEIVDFIL